MKNIINLALYGYPIGMFVSIGEAIAESLCTAKTETPQAVVEKPIISDEPDEEVDPSPSVPADSSTESEAEILALREQGMSFVAIARELNVELSTVIQIINSRTKQNGNNQD